VHARGRMNGRRTDSCLMVLSGMRMQWSRAARRTRRDLVPRPTWSVAFPFAPLAAPKSSRRMLVLPLM